MNDSAQHLLILYDGDCALCHGLVRYALKNDPQDKFRFSSLQSPYGQAILEQHQLPLDDFDSFVLVEKGRVYLRSTGALKALGAMGGWKKNLQYLLVLPGPIRDWAYRLTASTRKWLFGSANHCEIPAPEWREKFLWEK